MPKYNFVLANGINTDGKGNIDILAADLRARGHTVVDVNLPIRHSVTALWKDAEEDARIIAQTKGVVPGSIIVGHSFGGPRITMAMRKMYFCAALYINPAQSRSQAFTGILKSATRPRTAIYCIHAPKDYVIMSGKVFTAATWALTAGQVNHPFGLAGAYGFKSPRVTNIPISGWGHKTAFTKHRKDTCDLAVAIGAKHWQGVAI